MRVLCSGDLHIGRRSSRLPTDLDQDSLSCASAWDAIVDHAINQQVDLVALSGDLVDQANRYYEAIGPLERGLRRLGAAGIPTVAVAGNHDHDVLPELARLLPQQHFRLLGRGGKWERAEIVAKDGSRLYVDGWSFPKQHVRENPLASYDLPVATDAPILGLLHTELETPASPYAPVALGDLRSKPVSLWLLGHIHAARLHGAESAVPVLYPGSPQPMDPGETGTHGAWVVEFVPGVQPVPSLVPLATVRYESLEIDVSAARDLPDARELVVGRVRDAGTAMLVDAGRLAHLSLRVVLTGRSPLRGALERESVAMTEDLRMPLGATTLRVERVEVATRPTHDLEALAAGSDAPSVLARLLLSLERGEELGEYRELMDAVRRVPVVLGGARPYRSLPGSQSPDETALRQSLARQTGLLLDQLLSTAEVAA